jgi:integrase
VRPSTLARVRDVLPHLDVFSLFPLDDIRPAAVEDHVAALACRAPRQAELALRVLKQLLANAKERGHVVDEGVFRLKAPRRDQPEMRFLDWDEVEELAANTVAPSATSSSWPPSPASGRANCSRSATATSTSRR